MYGDNTARIISQLDAPRSALITTTSTAPHANLSVLDSNFVPTEEPRSNLEHQNSAENVVISLLREKLLDARVPSFDDDTRSFIPIDALRRIITRERILQALSGPISSQTCSGHQLDVDAIHITCRKLFTVLTIIGKCHTITDFLAENISDVDLPFQLLGKNSISTTPRTSLRSSSSSTIATSKTWNRWELDRFYREQWCVLAPVFTKEGQYYDFPDYVVLPLISTPSRERSPKAHISGFSEVVAVKIQPGHHNFWSITQIASEVGLT
ncbi:hypothetical protein G7Y89_g5761 [Cudoniella acicularis]|uniref:Uncharacterized protein n=1 Tax=Cudoniella acicularis TaxID=354080 RepID=A0A8H4RLV1_9HELO|nr:hypothetical protein G7Y89_g5761 [Cudoniella acicularis]